MSAIYTQCIQYDTVQTGTHLGNSNVLRLPVNHYGFGWFTQLFWLSAAAFAEEFSLWYIRKFSNPYISLQAVDVNIRLQRL